MRLLKGAAGTPAISITGPIGAFNSLLKTPRPGFAIA